MKELVSNPQIPFELTNEQRILRITSCKGYMGLSLYCWKIFVF